MSEINGGNGNARMSADTTLSDDSEQKELVLVSSSYPSQISLKLRVIEKLLKLEPLGCMDVDCLNLAIRKMVREVSDDGNLKKHYVSVNFSRYAISKKDSHSDMETCIRDEFLDQHNGSNDPHCKSNLEVLCIPVIHDGHWTLYAFNMNDHKLSILDPNVNLDSNINDKRHKGIRLKICKALEFAKAKFNLFENKSHDFRNWVYEFAKVPQQEISCDSGFLVFNFMRLWDGYALSGMDKVISLTDVVSLEESKKLRQKFLAYILSFKDNEAFLPPDDVVSSQWIKDLPSVPAWTRSPMDNGLLKAVSEGNADELKKSYEGEDALKSVLHATSDGDGVLHIAARFGQKQLVIDMIANLLQGEGKACEVCIDIGYKGRAIQTLTARNHRGETCLHEAVRWGRKDLVELLISADTGTSPPLVQVVDYQGVSPLYLAATLRRADIVDVLIGKDKCSYSGPEGKTALHAAVLLSKELSDLLLKRKPNLAGKADRFGRTPLHLLASAGGAPIAKLFLPIEDATSPDGTASRPPQGGDASKDRPDDSHPEHEESRSSSSIVMAPSEKGDAVKDRPKNTHLVLKKSSKASSGCATFAKLFQPAAKVSKNTLATPKEDFAALKKDLKGRFPIHVAAANGRLDIIEQMHRACPECMSSRNASGQSFLHVAVDMSRINVVNYVCKQSGLADVLNMRDQDGNTALHLAVKSGNQRIFCSLMSNKRVCLSFPNKEGRTPRDLCLLGMEPAGLTLLQNTRMLTRFHLWLVGADFGTYPRGELLAVDRAGKLDKEKLSETMSKSAGILAVCAIFMLNISVTAFFNVAKEYRPPTVTNEAMSKSERARRSALKALMVFDVIAFASSAFCAFCSTFAGFPVVDLPSRLKYLLFGGVSLQIASLAVVAVFMLAAYLAFVQVEQWIAILSCALALAAILPQLAPVISLLLHAWSLLYRLVLFDAIQFFQKYVGCSWFGSSGRIVTQKHDMVTPDPRREGRSSPFLVKIKQVIVELSVMIWKYVLVGPTIIALVACIGPILLALLGIAIAIGVFVALVGGLIFIIARG